MGLRTQLTACLLATCLGLLAACGGGGSDSSAPPPSSPGGSAPTTGDLVSVAVLNPPQFVAVGGSLQLVIIIRNPSRADARDVQLDVATGAGIDMVQLGCMAGYVNCPPASTRATLPLLPAGAEWRIFALAKLTPSFRGAIDATVTATAAGDTNSANNRAQFRVDVSTSDVSVAGVADGSEFLSGGTATYVMTLTNNGPDASQQIHAQNALSSGQSLVAITCAASGGASCPASTGATMQIPGMPPGGSLAFTVTSSIDATTIGTIGNTFHVSVEGDAVSSNNVSTVSATARAPVSHSTPSFVILQSDSGDYIGNGQRYAYDRSNASLSLTDSGSRATLSVRGDEIWNASFSLPGDPASLQPGVHVGVPRMGSGSSGNFSWSGEGRGCNASQTTLYVDDVSYTSAGLATLDVRFEQHCEGGSAALRGQIHWNAGDLSAAPGPVNPPPAGLWSPAAGATPATGNFVYLKSDPGDYIGLGRTTTYTSADAMLSVQLVGEVLSVSVNGDEQWSGSFATMASLAQMAPGYYGNLQRFPFHNPARGGLSWHGEGRGCNTLTGWFIVDSISFAESALASIDLRFEQHCEGAPAALRGRIRWIDGDAVEPPGPQVPPPAGLWSPPAGATPAAGNYVYLQSDAGDYIGAGRTHTYTHADSLIQVSANGGRLDLGINGDEDWGGQFQAMNTLSQLQPGYYGNLQRFPFHNPARGGMSWSGEGRGCNVLTGWFVIDSISYSGSSLASVDLRFEQHCEGGGPALRGKVHWLAGNVTPAPGPQAPPAGLWSPPAGATPASGNYVYLQSDAGDYIGQGRTELYTPSDTTMNLFTRSGGLGFSLARAQSYWNGDFQAMIGLGQLQPGYYGSLQRYPFHNPVRGGLSWSGEHRGCNTLTGWFVVDSVTYIGGTIASLDLRFEQHCEGAGPALRGKIHWVN